MMKLFALLAALLLAAPALAQNGANDLACQSGGAPCVRVPVQSSPPTLSGHATDWLTQTTAGGLRVQLQDGAGHDAGLANPLPVSIVTSSSASAGVAPLVAPSGVAASRVIRASAGLVAGLQVSSGASAGWVLLYDAASAPSDGAVTPLKVYRLGASSSLILNWPPGQELKVSTGLVAVFSTTGPTTQTSSATAYFTGDVL